MLVARVSGFYRSGCVSRKKQKEGCIIDSTRTEREEMEVRRLQTLGKKRGRTTISRVHRMGAK